MAILSKKEFADLCKIPTKDLATYIKRKKVSVSEDNTIDTTIQVNSNFLSLRTSKQIESPAAVINQPVLNPTEVAAKVNFGSLDLEKKALDIEKIGEEIQILKVKKEKLHGIVIPTELVKIIFSQHTKSILVEFSNSVDKTLTYLSKKLSIGNKEQSEIRKELNDEINKAVDRAIEESKKAIKGIVDEFSEKKGRGERI